MRNWKPIPRPGARRTCPAIQRIKSGATQILLPREIEPDATHVTLLAAHGVIGLQFGASGAKLFKPSPTSAVRAACIPRWVGRLYPVGTTDVELVKEDGVYVLTLPKGAE